MFLSALGALMLAALQAGSQEAEPQPGPLVQPLRLNDIQLLGSHNSYKLKMAPERFAALYERRPDLAASLEYWHIPLAEQLQLGLRKLELDVFYDPTGELFGAASGEPPPASQFPVLHVQNLDDRSSCPTLVVCLEELRRWSQAHPEHVPVFISINAKDSAIDLAGSIKPLRFREPSWQALDAEIRGVFGDSLITPAQVFATGARVWPELESVRGRFVMILDEAGEKRSDYASRWRERAMFANLPQSHAGAAIMVVNDPQAEFDRIRSLVTAGLIVRTRADADTREARTNDQTRSSRAFASGAQLISTDYYLPAQHFGTGYVVELPQGPRCNPVRRPDTCEFHEELRSP